MGTMSPHKDHFPSLTKKLLPWTFYAIIFFVVFRLYYYPCPILHSNHITIPSPSSLSVSRSLEKGITEETPCDYTDGKWVPKEEEPLYNGTSCGTIKDGQNCLAHGRPDTGYLHWRWQPNHCKLPRFDPNKFLQLFSNKHLAFVGDSMARNQLESLLCMLSTASPPKLIYTNGEDNKFRRWNFGSHNLNLSIYWSPFLVKGVEKMNSGPNHNQLHLDQVDERWGNDLSSFDTVVFSIGHWFLHPAVYYEKNSVLGCHYCPGLNHTEIGFYSVLQKALKTTLNAVTESSIEKGIDVLVTTFSPSHFEGEWDKFGACPKTVPYKEGEKPVEGMDAEIRQIEVQEVELAKGKTNGLNKVRIEALDVTKLSLMRPDGHPGPYMYPNPFADGVKERVQNDCVHWCLPGPIDTWNEIMVEIVKRWKGKQSLREE